MYDAAVWCVRAMFDPPQTPTVLLTVFRGSNTVDNYLYCSRVLFGSSRIDRAQ